MKKAGKRLRGSVLKIARLGAPEGTTPDKVSRGDSSIGGYIGGVTLFSSSAGFTSYFLPVWLTRPGGNAGVAPGCEQTNAARRQAC